MDATTVGELVREAAEAMESAGLCFAHGTDNAVDEAAALVAHVIGSPEGLTRARLERPVSGAEKTALRGLLERRINERIPVPYLLGYSNFAGLAFNVDRRALVPRSPIGELVEQGFGPWVDASSLRRVLDIGTGCGCIAIATAVHLPETRVDAVDVSAEALSLAQENVEYHGVAERVRLLRSDLFGSLAGERYDLVITNPPYVGRAEYESLPAEFRHEPSGGLVAEGDGMALMLRILAAAPDHLEPDGRVIGEVGHGREFLEQVLPDVPFIWLEFERGGEGVFLLEGDGVLTAAAEAAQVLAGDGIAPREAAR